METKLRNDIQLIYVSKTQDVLDWLIADHL